MEVGAIVRCRGRDWVVMPSWILEPELLPEVSPDEVWVLRSLFDFTEPPLMLYRQLTNTVGYELPQERPAPSQFPLPELEGVQDAKAAHLLWQATRLSLRHAAAPLRSLGNLAIRPRAYQLVPLLMALRMDPVRLFIADDVGIGKTIEALLIVRELYDRGVIQRFVVLCPPYLCDQWANELYEKFGLEAEVVRAGTARSLERSLPSGETLYTHFPILVISIDWVKSDRHRALFLQYCPELVIVDEAHGAAESSVHTQQERHRLLREVAQRPDRHLILLTATPHSGIEGAFRSLMALLHPDFGEWDFSHLTPDQKKRLAYHFIQRTRKDIRQLWEPQSCFPQRLREDVTYALSPEYEALFQKTYQFCKGIVESGQALAEHKRRVRYWGALALLRCVMSSPAAAIETIKVRLQRENLPLPDIDETPADEDLSNYIFEPTAETTDDENPLPPIEYGLYREERSFLYDLYEHARALYDTPRDTKTEVCLQALEKLVREGYNPIVWCRYVATAEYLGKRLRDRIQSSWDSPSPHVIVITGRLSEEERRAYIRSIDPNRPRILVATDCLSEGINLQELFSAVLHYDLPWNPNRLEQREGRVDRYGQPSPRVKVIHFYGRNNPIDGVVLEVLLKKAREIHQTLGTAVPFPEESESLSEVLLRALFFREGVQSNRQLSLFASQEVIAFHKSWEKNVERERNFRTSFAQSAFKPEEVLKDLEATDKVLGDPEAVQAFVREAAQRYEIPIYPDSKQEGVYRLPLSSAVRETLPERVQQALPPAEREEWRVSFVSPAPEGANYLGRSHPFVVALAQHVIEEAFTSPEKAKAARTGALRTRAVSYQTILLLLRARYLIWEERETLAEEIVVMGYEPALRPHEPPRRWLSDDEALTLLKTAQPDTNLSLPEKRELIAEALNDLQPWGQNDPDTPWGQTNPLLTGIRKSLLSRASALTESYLRLRKAIAQKGRTPHIRPHFPPDLIGLIVLQPIAEGVG